MDAQHLDPKGFSISFDTDPLVSMRAFSVQSAAAMAARSIRESGQLFRMTVWHGVEECIVVNIVHGHQMVWVNADTDARVTAYIEKAIRNALAERVF